LYKTRIYYQDTDAGGVVYFANYLKLFEKSWFEYLVSIGISLPEWEKSDTYIIIRNASLDLMDKLKYGDIVQVDTSLKEIKNSYFIMSHSVSKDGKVTTEGETKMACINGQGRPKRMPEEFRARLLAHLNETETSE
jgi:acyl-CoA thioester hydrolase